MTRTCTLALVGAILISLPGCAGAPANGLAPIRRDPTVISAEELTAQDIIPLSAFDAINRLRPRWLTRRGTTSLAPLPRKRAPARRAR